MRYLPLFTLELTHPYYADNRTLDFRVEPSRETQRLLRNHRCILKSSANHIKILAATAASGEILIPLNPDNRFSFHLYLENSAFPLFSDLTDITPVLAPIYSNTTNDGTANPEVLALLPRSRQAMETFTVQQPNATEAFTLRGRPLPHLDANDFAIEGLDAVTTPTTYQASAKIIQINTQATTEDTPFTVTYATNFPTEPGTFSDIEIWPNASIPPIIDGPAKFQISFKAKSAHWRYYLITDRQNINFQIRDTATDPIIFDVENQVDLNATPDADDPVAQQLAKQYPDQQRYRFTSDTPVACQQNPRKTLQLDMEGDMVIDVLPNPALSNFLRQAVITDGNSHQEEVLYHVLKFLRS